MLRNSAIGTGSPHFKTRLFKIFRIYFFTSFCDNPNWCLIASNDVLSSPAISIMRLVSAMFSSIISISGCSTFIAAIFYLLPNAFPFFSPGKRSFTYHAYFWRYGSLFCFGSFRHIMIKIVNILLQYQNAQLSSGHSFYPAF